MTNPKQIQLTEIENGWLISAPPEPKKLSGNQPPDVGTVEFAPDYEGVCAVLKKHWPISTVISK